MFLIYKFPIQISINIAKCLQPLADISGCQVLAYDRLGSGLTERVLDGQFYTRKSEELLASELLNQLNISNNMHIVSSSSGADVAFEIAIARPDLIQSIIFVVRYNLINVQHSFGLTHFLSFKNSYFNENIARDDGTRESYLKPIRDDPLFLNSFVLFTQNYVTSSTINEWYKLSNKLKILIIIGEHDKNSIKRKYSRIL
ncbi:unnamed protein product [Rotaria socialis]|uniref:Uncharacterized protein n=1 Tax=Rotaria socialis TaxID=392032 RepID=A0A818GWW0_9BILA|nr:unnamed protein product [Rotaria socialis]